MLAAVICWAGVVLWAPPASADDRLTVTPSSGLITGQVVTVHGSGFPAGTQLLICQMVPNDPVQANDCGGAVHHVTSSANGTFTDQYPVQKIIFIQSDGRWADCGAGNCSIAAAVPTDVAGTIGYGPISFDPAQPDGRIKNRASGQIKGDGIYSLDGAGQTASRAVHPGEVWSFAVQAQNDGETADDIRVRAPSASSPFTVRYFVGYYDVTSAVTGAGLTFGNVGVGQIRGLAVQIRAAANAPVGARFDAGVVLTSVRAKSSDKVVVGVVVTA
jgi:hypothetical protein